MFDRAGVFLFISQAVCFSAGLSWDSSPLIRRTLDGVSPWPWPWYCASHPGATTPSWATPPRHLTHKIGMDFNIFSVRRHSVLEHFPRSRVFLRVLFFHWPSWDFCSMPGNTGNSGNLDHLQRYLHCRQKVHFLGKCFHFVHFEFVISRVTKSAVLWQVDQVVLHLFYLQKPKAYMKKKIV